ncbi:MAG: glycosyltransferase, partial [Chthoniobacterales bacterium]
GVLVTNLAWWRSNKVEEEAMQLAKEAGRRCKWYDQTVFNFLFRHDFRELPARWNFQSEAVNSNVGVVHFTTGRKPWRYLGPSARFRAWRMMLRSCGLSPTSAIFRHGGLRGLALGMLETAVRCSRAGRKIVLPALLAIDRKNSAGNGTYYSVGPGAVANSTQVDRTHPLLSKLGKKIKSEGLAARE